MFCKFWGVGSILLLVLFLLLLFFYCGVLFLLLLFFELMSFSTPKLDSASIITLPKALETSVSTSVAIYV